LQVSLYSLPLKTQRTLQVNSSRYPGEDEEKEKQLANDRERDAAINP